jgi:polyisoprenoid-binding protein YceI
MKKKLLIIGGSLALVGIITGIVLYNMDWGNAESELEKSGIDTVSDTTTTDSGVKLANLNEISGMYAVNPDTKKREIFFAADGIKDTRGTFKKFDVSLDLTNGYENAKLRVVISAKSLFTDNESRDDHLKKEEFFHVSKYPEIIFEANSMTLADTSYMAHGKLSMLGVSKELDVPFSYLGYDTYEDGKEFAAFEGRFPLDQYDYGMAESKSVKSEVGVTFYVEMIKAEEQ